MSSLPSSARNRPSTAQREIRCPLPREASRPPAGPLTFLLESPGICQWPLTRTGRSRYLGAPPTFDAERGVPPRRPGGRARCGDAARADEGGRREWVPSTRSRIVCNQVLEIWKRNNRSRRPLDLRRHSGEYSPAHPTLGLSSRPSLAPPPSAFPAGVPDGPA